MTSYSSIAAWQAAQTVGAPGVQWLLQSDLKALGNADWSAASSVTIDGVSIPIEKSGTWTTLGPDGSTGVVLDPSGSPSSFYFAPTITGLASAFGLTTTEDDQWIAMMSFAAPTLTAANSLLRVRPSNTAQTTGFLCDMIQSSGVKFRVNNSVGFSETAPGTAVRSMGIHQGGRGLWADYRYSTSETLDWSSLEQKVGHATNSVQGTLTTSILAASNKITTDIIRIGGAFNSAADGAVLTGLVLGWIPGP